MVLSTDYTGRCKSNYHTITTTTVPTLYQYHIIPNTKCKNHFRIRISACSVVFEKLYHSNWRIHDAIAAGPSFTTSGLTIRQLGTSHSRLKISQMLILKAIKSLFVFNVSPRFTSFVPLPV